MYEFLLNSFQHPLILALVLFLSTYVLEDVAIVTAALLTADGLLSPGLAFIALFSGVFSGDLGLYGLGLFIKKASKGKKHIGSQFLNMDKVLKAGGWLERRVSFTVLFVRVIPGLRLPVYTACGFFKLSFFKFTALVFLASILWTAALYFGLFGLSSLFWEESGVWKWLLLPLIVLLIIYSYRFRSSFNGVLK